MDPSTAPSSANATDAAEKPVTSQAAVVNDEPTYVYVYAMVSGSSRVPNPPLPNHRVILIFGWRAFLVQGIFLCCNEC